MSNFQYYDDDPFTVDLVYHSVFSDSDAVDIIVAAHLPATVGARINCQKRNRSQDTHLVLSANLFQLPFSSS
jgi:hypothetical protein